MICNKILVNVPYEAIAYQNQSAFVKNMSSLSYETTFNISAYGSISANNPIDISVIVSNITFASWVQPKNFSYWVCCIGLSGATNSTSQFYPDGREENTIFNLQQVNYNTRYISSEKGVTFLHEGPVWLIPLPPHFNETTTVLALAHFRHGDPVIVISSQSDTLNPAVTANSYRIIVALLSFSVILVPVVERIIGDHDPARIIVNSPPPLDTPNQVQPPHVPPGKGRRQVRLRGRRNNK